MQDKPQNENSRTVLAVILIVVGMIWLLRQGALYFNLPIIHLHNIFAPVREALRTVGHLIFSWPVIFIVIGLVLMAGKRRAGVFFLVIGGVFLIPKLFFPGMLMMLFLPLVLIGIGVAIVARLL